MPQLRVLLFASLRDAHGAPELTLDLDERITARALLGLLERRFPRFAGRLGVVRVAVDRRFCADDEEIPFGAEVALIPPVSGGAARSRGRRAP